MWRNIQILRRARITFLSLTKRCSVNSLNQSTTQPQSAPTQSEKWLWPSSTDGHGNQMVLSEHPEPFKGSTPGSRTPGVIKYVSQSLQKSHYVSDEDNVKKFYTLLKSQAVKARAAADNAARISGAL